MTSPGTSSTIPMRFAWIVTITTTVGMELWLRYAETNSLFGMGRGHDDISWWWTVHVGPFFVAFQGTIALAIALCVASRVQKGQNTEASALALTVSFVAVVFVFASVAGKATSLGDFLFSWWPMHVWVVLLFLYGLFLRFEAKKRFPL